MFIALITLHTKRKRNVSAHGEISAQNIRKMWMEIRASQNNFFPAPQFHFIACDTCDVIAKGE